MQSPSSLVRSPPHEFVRFAMMLTAVFREDFQRVVAELAPANFPTPTDENPFASL